MRRELKVARIGNSRGVRIPATTLEKYRIGATVSMEERPEGILLRPHDRGPSQLSWEATAGAMAASAEDWSEWEGVAADGLEYAPWESARPARVAEPRSEYAGARTRRGPRKSK